MDVPCICCRVGLLTLAPSLGQPHGWDERQGLEQTFPSAFHSRLEALVGDEDPRTLGLVASFPSRLPMSPLCRGEEEQSIPGFPEP